MNIGFWWGNLKERDHSDYIGLDGKIILKYILNHSSGSGWGHVAGCMNAVIDMRVP